jgi:HEAT repeat protein
VRRAAVAASHALDDPRTPERAVALLADGDARVRESAVRLVSSASGTAGIDRLEAACGDDSELVSAAALERLAALDPERAVPRLLEGLRAASARVRAAACAGSAGFPAMRPTRSSARSTTPTRGCATSPSARSPSARRGAPWTRSRASRGPTGRGTW